ncbi:DUF4232 domain-containing protein [Acetobacteraceae bacterium]|nr:DUF4232 domain-containing protein [Acetobacteraceae bacterium]
MLRKTRFFIFGSISGILCLVCTSNNLYASSIGMQLPSCQAGAITLNIDQKIASTSGMSHDAADLTFINSRTTSCSITTRPEISFLNGGKRPLPIAFRTENLSDSQSTLKEITIPAGGKAKMRLRWVSQKLFDKNLCYKTSFLALVIQGEQTRIAFKNKICGDKTKGVVYETSLLTPDSKSGV